MFWDSEIEYPLSAEPELTCPGGMARKQSSKIPELSCDNVAVSDF